MYYIRIYIIYMYIYIIYIYIYMYIYNLFSMKFMFTNLQHNLFFSLIELLIIATQYIKKPQIVAQRQY